MVQLRRREPAGAIEGGRADQYPEPRRGTRFPPVAWFAMDLRVENSCGNCFRRQHRREPQPGPAFSVGRTTELVLDCRAMYAYRLSG